MHLYPNPATDQVTPDISGIFNGAKTTVNVYDVGGRLVLHQQINTAIIELSVSALERGDYQLVVSGNKTTGSHNPSSVFTNNNTVINDQQ